MSFDPVPLFDAVQSHALASGLFERVNTHEPKNAPGEGLTAAIWVQSIGPTKSGLASTSVRVVFTVRIFQNMLLEPQDAIDPMVLSAVGTLMEAYTGDFTLGDLVRNVDLMGSGGIALTAQAGYLSIDGKMMRVMDITLPVIVNDVWTQVS